MNILAEAKALPGLLEDRRWLHSHAQTGFDLEETVAYVERRLTELGYHPTKCGRAGLIATVGNGNQTLLLRADMDALPIREESGLPFACLSGNMHACGHDMHTAMLLGAAQLLKAHEAELKCTVKLMFQGAEEILAGARDMIENGVLSNPRPNAAIMLHVLASLPLPSGTVIVSEPGVSAPAADIFTLTVTGRGCHGSTPQHGIDALNAAAHTLIALQELTARETSAASDAVLTVGAFQGGSAPNAIADKAVLAGSLRAYDEATRSFLKQRLAEITQGICGAFRAKGTVEFGSGCPTFVNDRELSEYSYRELLPLLGKDRICYAGSLGSTKSGGSEDFAYISQQVPSLMLAMAAGEPDKGFSYPQHHPKVVFDESVLPIGAAVYARIALQFGAH